MSKQITITIDDELMTKLKHIVEIKGGTVEETATKVIEQYSDRYIKLVEGARKAATNSVNQYDR